jgi:hypothetical protein
MLQGLGGHRRGPGGDVSRLQISQTEAQIRTLEENLHELQP